MGLGPKLIHFVPNFKSLGPMLIHFGVNISALAVKSPLKNTPSPHVVHKIYIE